MMAGEPFHRVRVQQASDLAQAHGEEVVTPRPNSLPRQGLPPIRTTSNAPNASKSRPSVAARRVTPAAQFIPAPGDWHPNIVFGKGYDLSTGIGAGLWSAVLERLRLRRAADVPPIDADRESRRAWVEQRLGQGTFRSRVTDAYGRRCAVTGERTLPVLEAAHIKPYAQQGPNRVDNGLLLRSDLHRLFDRGLVTVAPERLTFQVSDRIRHEYSNGRVYDELAGKPLIVLPERPDERPSRAFLEHHRSVIFRP
jgi:putative restriction endonuclease